MRKSGWFERKTDDSTQQSCPLISSVQEDLHSETDQFRFLPTYPSPNPTYCPNWDTNVDVELARGRWAVSSKSKLIPKGFCYNSVALKHGWGRLFFGWTTFTFGLRQESEQDFRISLCLFTSFSGGLRCRQIPQNSDNKPRGLCFSKALFEGLIFGGAYIRREVCVSKSARLILGGKFASQNRLG